MSLVTYKDLLNEAHVLFKVHPRDIQGKDKFNFILPARFAVWKALKDTGTSYAQIGRWFERDHSTIIHGARRATQLMEQDLDYRAKVLTLTRLKNTTKEQTDVE